MSLATVSSRKLSYLIAFAVVLGAAILLWNMAHDHTALSRQTPAMPIVALTPPPPPPPPPPKTPPPPEPPKVQMETPQPQPNPRKSAADSATGAQRR